LLGGEGELHRFQPRDICVPQEGQAWLMLADDCEFNSMSDVLETRSPGLKTRLSSLLAFPRLYLFPVISIALGFAASLYPILPTFQNATILPFQLIAGL
jgi:hypothetical protein